jgi:ubiquinone/menaquinone biosynthesis C-methylase UbiE
MRKIFCAILAASAAIVIGSLWWRRESQRRQLPCPAWLAWLLENPFMDTVAGTQATLDHIGVRPGERLLDVGSGPGRLAIPAAQRAGPHGSVTAVDVQPEMLARLRQRAARAGVANIEPHLMDISAENNLDPESYDRAWLVTVLGEIPDKAAALRNIYHALRPGGTLSITEILPDPHYQRYSLVMQLGQSAGFEPAGHWGNFLSFTQNFVKPERENVNRENVRGSAV